MHINIMLHFFYVGMMCHIEVHMLRVFGTGVLRREVQEGQDN